MKHLLLFSIVLFFAFSCKQETNTQTSTESLSVIPEPVDYTVLPGSFTVDKRTILFFNHPDLVSVANFLNKQMEPAMGFSLSVEEGAGKGIQLQLLAERDEELGKEGYRLDVTSGRTVISATEPNGIFYGIQTFLQLFPPEIKSKTLQEGVAWEASCVEIEDVPRFPWRGLMLDVSRHFFTKEEVKKYIDQLAEYKMNVFHWHLTDDQGWRIDIESLPNLTEKGAWRARRVGQWWKRIPRQEGEPADYGGYYTHEDIREVVEYAKERFVEIVPEIDVPGHSMAAIVAYPEISCTQTASEVNVGNVFYTEVENSLCVGNDLTFEYLEKIFSEVAMLFPSDYIHGGGDECYKGFWSECPKCNNRMKEENLENTDELQSYFIKRMEKMLETFDKRLIGWDEILEGGLAPNATVMSWRGMKGGVRAAQAGHHVIMTPNNHCYLDLYQGEPSVEPDTYSMCRLTDSYHFEPVPEGVDAELILGGQGNLWTESVPHFRHAEYMTWPRGWALAEVLWSPEEVKNWNRFVEKVKNHFVRADFEDIKYARSMYNAIITPYYDENEEMQIELDTEFEGLDLRYTFDNTDPDLYSPQYSHSLSIPRNATWLKVISYRGEQPAGELITLRIDELRKRIK